MRPTSSIEFAVNCELHSVLVAANYIGLCPTAGLFTSYARRKRAHVCAVKWDKPPIGLVKLNSDGASRGNPGLSGGEGVIQDTYVGVFGLFLLFVLRGWF